MFNNHKERIEELVEEIEKLKAIVAELTNDYYKEKK